MTRLALRRGVVVGVDSAGPVARIRVNVGSEERSAIAYVDFVGPVEVGDDVVVNVAAVDLALGSGGFDIVHVNLTRGLEGTGEPGAHVMKLNYTSLQHAIDPVEAHPVDQTDAMRPKAQPRRAVGRPVAVIALHAQLPCVAWAAAQHTPGARIGYIQTWGGALPGPLGAAVQQLKDRNLIAGHITAGQAFGGEHEAISTAGAIDAGLTTLNWDAAIVGPGPGIIGSETELGHGGMAALESAHAALALGCRTILVPRMSSGDPRPRHQGISHHTQIVLDLLLKPVALALPDGVAVDLAGYGESGLPGRTMGRAIEEDELFFRAALAGGVALAEEIDGVREGRV